MTSQANDRPAGILLVDKPRNKSSFSLVAALRRLLNVQKIGHAGTLDPFATGVMVMLIGKQFTKLSNTFLAADKEYLATVRLGIETDTYDCDGRIIAENGGVPSETMLKNALEHFQGTILQTPPMFSAKKKNGKKLYELARKGISIQRESVPVAVKAHLLSYQYPHVELHIECSKGTYIRSIAHDLGKTLGCGAHLSALRRMRSGTFHIDSCINGAALFDQSNCDIDFLKRSLNEYCTYA